MFRSAAEPELEDNCWVPFAQIGRFFLHIIRYRSTLAQLVEQLTVNQPVAGSSPAGGATSNLNGRSFPRSNSTLGVIA